MARMNTQRESASMSSAAKTSKRQRVPIAQAKKMGRPVKYRPEFADMMDAYFCDQALREVPLKNGGVQFVMPRPPTLAGFALSLGVCLDTICRWATETGDDGKSLRYPDFSESYARAMTRLQDLNIVGGLMGAYQPHVVGLALKNVNGWKDKVESVERVEHAFDEAKVAELDRIYAEGRRKADLLNAKVGKGPLAGDGVRQSD